MQSKKIGLDNKEKIIKELKKNLSGFTASELSKNFDILKLIVSNFFVFLESAEKVKTVKASI